MHSPHAPIENICNRYIPVLGGLQADCATKSPRAIMLEGSRNLKNNVTYSLTCLFSVPHGHTCLHVVLHSS